MARPALAAAAACALLACAAPAPRAPGAADAPEWIATGESPRFPRARYLAGIGVADDRSAAENRARAAIASVLKVHVQAQVRAVEVETSMGAGGSATTASAQQVSHDVRAQADQALEGAEIVDGWRDATGRHHVLAVMDRVEAAGRRLGRLAEVDAALARELARCSGDPDRLARAAAGARILPLLAAREPIAEQIGVLTPGAVPPPPRPVDQLRAAATDAISAVVIGVAVLGDPDEAHAVESGAVEALTRLRMRVADGTEKPDIAVAAQVDWPDDTSDDRWTYSRATVVLTATATATGDVVASFSESAREAAAAPLEARRRALASLTTAVARRIADGVAAYLSTR
jgi:hypothetical protein